MRTLSFPLVVGRRRTVSTVIEFPSLSWMDDGAERSRAGLQSVVSQRRFKCMNGPAQMPTMGTVRLYNDVDIPIELLDALEQGELAFFVGAGASKAPPSDLPDFRGLVDRIADAAAAGPYDGITPFDKFLGDLERANVDVNQIASRLLGEADGEPNALHHAVVRLAKASKAPKIVTTNFDEFINIAWEEENGPCQQWTGPALPLGDDFEGIVQLHGSLNGRITDWVLTDRSFGAAYLTRSWASRFLVELFDNNVVVFIGYSHGDPVMKYLATALPAGTRRYAFVGIPENGISEDVKILHSLGIKPVVYPSANGHAALPAALEAWAHYSEADWLGQRKRLKQILATLDNLTPLDADILEQYLESESGLDQFASVCENLTLSEQKRVLIWLRGQPKFGALFRRRQMPEVVSSGKLGRWLASYFLTDESTIVDLWSSLDNYGTELREDFYSHLETAAYVAHRKGKPYAETVLRFLHTSIPGITCPIKSSTTSPFEQVVKRSISVPEIASLSTTRVIPRVTSDLDGKTAVYFRIAWNSHATTLRRLLKGEPASVAADVTDVVVASLVSAYRLSREFNPAQTYDQVAGWIIDLEGAEDHSHASILISWLVRQIQAGNVTEDERLRWWSSDVPLLRRLSLVALRHEKEFTPEQKLQWLLDSSISLLDPKIRSEALDLAAHCVPGVASEMRSTVFSRLLVEADNSLDLYRALKITSEGIDNWPQAQAELARLETEDASVRQVIANLALPSEPPHLDSAYKPLESPQELDNYLRQFDDWDVQRTPEDLKDGVRTFAEESPCRVLELAEAAAHLDNAWSSEVLTEVIETITAESIDQNPVTFSAVLAVAGASHIDAFSRLIARQAFGVKSQSGADAIQLGIDSLWQIAEQEFIDSEFDFFEPVIRVPELLVHGLIGLAFAKWKTLGYQTEDVSTWFISRVGLLLRSKRLQGQTLRALGRRLSFISALDGGFVSDDLIPHFKSSRLGKHAWAGFLQTKQVSLAEPFRSHLFELLMFGWGKTADDARLQHEFFSFVSSIIRERLYLPAEVHQLLDKGSAVMNDQDRAKFVRSIEPELANAIGENYWNEVVRDYIFRRLNEVPTRLEQDEFKAIADLPIAAPAFAADLIPAIQRTNRLHEFPIDTSSLPIDVTDKLSQPGSEELAAYLIERIRAAGIDPDAHIFLLAEARRVKNPGSYVSSLVEVLEF